MMTRDGLSLLSYLTKPDTAAPPPTLVQNRIKRPVARVYSRLV